MECHDRQVSCVLIGFGASQDSQILKPQICYICVSSHAFILDQIIKEDLHIIRMRPNQIRTKYSIPKAVKISQSV